MQISIFILGLHYRFFFQRWHCLSFISSSEEMLMYSSLGTRIKDFALSQLQPSSLCCPDVCCHKKPRGYVSGEVLWLSIKAKRVHNGSDSDPSGRPWSDTTDWNRFGISGGASRTGIGPLVSVGSPKCPFLRNTPYVLRLLVCWTPDNEVFISKLVLETCFDLASVRGEEILQNISKLYSIPLHCNGQFKENLLIHGFPLGELLCYVANFSRML